MPELRFFVEGMAPLAHAFVPTLGLRLRAVNGAPEPVHSMLVRCQIMIEPARRRYSTAEQPGLAALFAGPERYGETLRPFLWQQVTTLVPGFTGTVVTEVPLACSLDFDLAATQYLDAVAEGEIPMRIFFSGTVFHQGEGGVQATPIPWDLDAAYRFPARLWRECMDAYYPRCAWLRLGREAFTRLLAERSARGAPGWDALIDSLLQAAPSAGTAPACPAQSEAA